MLKEQAIRGAGWSAVQHLGRQGIHFVISIILARLLLPEHYGVIGVLVVFIAVSRTVIDSGFGQALIQKRDSSYIDECSMFYTNISLSILMYLALYSAAPLIENFYQMPQLTTLTRVLCLQLVIQSFGLVHSTLLSKRIDFRTQARITLASVIISGGIGIIMAYSGFGVWSLVAQILLGSIINTSGLWISFDWRPSFCFSFQSIRSLFGFGSKVLASSLIDTFFRNIYTVVIGKVFSPADLGHYARGYSLTQLPVQNLAVIVRRVTFPVFSSISDDRPRIKRGMQKSLAILFFVNCPVVIGIAAVADTFVYVVLTDKWAQCIPYIRLLSISGLLYPLHVINLNALLSIGRSDLFLRLEIIKKTLTVVAIAITYRWGIEAMIIGQICQSFFAYVINAYYTGRFFEYSYWPQIRDVLPYLLTSALMGVCVYSMRMLPFENLVLMLCCQIITGVIAYVSVSYIFGLEAFRELNDILRAVIIHRHKHAVVS
jgi:O-antigen/teichoic acid export membrane protein